MEKVIQWIMNLSQYKFLRHIMSDSLSDFVNFRGTKFVGLCPNVIQKACHAKVVENIKGEGSQGPKYDFVCKNY
jgi:hypothetical protein